MEGKTNVAVINMVLSLQKLLLIGGMLIYTKKRVVIPLNAVENNMNSWKTKYESIE